MFFQSTTYSLMWDKNGEKLIPEPNEEEQQQQKEKNRRPSGLEYLDPSRTPLETENDQNNPELTESKLTKLELERMYGLSPGCSQQILALPQISRLQFFMMDQQIEINPKDIETQRFIFDHLYLAVQLGDNFERTNGKNDEVKVHAVFNECPWHNNNATVIPSFHVLCEYKFLLKTWEITVFYNYNKEQRVRSPLTFSETLKTSLSNSVISSSTALKLHLFSSFPVDDGISPGIFKFISLGVIELCLTDIVEVPYDPLGEFVVEIKTFSFSNDRIKKYSEGSGTKNSVPNRQYRKWSIRGDAVNKNIPYYLFETDQGKEFKVKPVIKSVQK